VVILGRIVNCGAVAALSALAFVVDVIKRLCVEYDTRKYRTLVSRSSVQTDPVENVGQLTIRGGDI
jgi:hypothetical protein